MAATSLPVPLSPRIRTGMFRLRNQGAVRFNLSHPLAASHKGCVRVERYFLDVVTDLGLCRFFQPLLNRKVNIAFPEGLRITSLAPIRVAATTSFNWRNRPA